MEAPETHGELAEATCSPHADSAATSRGSTWSARRRRNAQRRRVSRTRDQLRIGSWIRTRELDRCGLRTHSAQAVPSRLNRLTPVPGFSVLPPWPDRTRPGPTFWVTFGVTSDPDRRPSSG